MEGTGVNGENGELPLCCLGSLLLQHASKLIDGHLSIRACSRFLNGPRSAELDCLEWGAVFRLGFNLQVVAPGLFGLVKRIVGTAK